MKDFTLQLHITDSCTHHCNHCYLNNRDYDRLDSKIITSSFDNLVNLTDYISDIVGHEVDPVVHLTGGDPMLRKDIFELVESATSKGVKVGLLGNPDTITEEKADRLFDAGARSFQISMDGMEAFHDKFRNKPGSFNESLRALETLKSAGIVKIFVMCNVSNENIDQVPELFSFLRERGLYGFVFARVCQAGQGKNVDTLIPPKRYKEFMYEMAEIDGNVFKEESGKTRLIQKDPLWSLYAHETGQLQPSDEIDGGCQAGISMMTMTSSGKLYACRRMEVEIDDHNADFVDVYLYNKTMNELRDFNNLEKCRNCPIVNNCRGCPAVPHGITGNMFAPDPQCWKEI